MITIDSFAIGNKEKSFCLNNFSSKINIIHSDDNNKGKTIVSQGIFYTLGNVPIFPRGFDDYEDYYYVVQLSVNGKKISVCRKKDFFIVNDESLKTYDSVNDFKRYFDSEIFKLPNLMKNGILHKAGIELFMEMVFLPQDKRVTSNIINQGRYNKFDFEDLIYAYNGCINQNNPQKIEEFTRQIKSLEENRKVLKNSSKLLKSKKIEASFATYTASKVRIDDKMKKVEKCKDAITELVNTKNRLINKITKNEILIKELISLNRELETGQLVCADCGSDKVVFESKEESVRFEISDQDTRSQIKSIILERIQVAKEDIADLDSKILEKKKLLAELMQDEDVSIENLLFYKNDIVNSSSIDSQIVEIDSQIGNLKDKISQAKSMVETETISKEDVYNLFIKTMQDFYMKVEPNDPLKITELFTKNNINYSGSQGALFLMSRLYACSKLLNIDFPIYIDHFRGGELSSLKEDLIIEEFNKLDKQIILSCTLKNEEKNKYANYSDVYDISFDNIEKFHLLQEKYNDEFREKMSLFSINLDIQK